jgi:hypothetical protein
LRTPVTYVVLRHKMTHPDEGAAAIARHCHLHDHSVRSALKRIQEEGIWQDAEILHKLRSLKEVPPRKAFHFSIPNPDQFLNSVTVPCWISGEFAAASEGYDLVPERLLVYVRPEDADAAAKAAQDEFAKVAPHSRANLTIALADPWLYLDSESDLVERGQRLIDYRDSRHIQILRGLPRG